MLELEVEDSTGERITVIMTSEAAKAAFGDFDQEHMEPKFWKGARFTTHLYYVTYNNLWYATRCARVARVPVSK